MADNVELRNIETLNILNNKKIKITLLFDTNSNLTKKIKSEIKLQRKAFK